MYEDEDIGRFSNLHYCIFNLYGLYGLFDFTTLMYIVVLSLKVTLGYFFSS